MVRPFDDYEISIFRDYMDKNSQTEYHNTKLTEEQQERFDQWLKTEDAILQAHFLSNHQSARYTRLKVANVSKEILKKDTKRNLFTRTTEKLPQAKANPLKRAAAMTMKRPATVLDTRLKNKKIKTASSSQKPGSTKPHVSKALQTGHPRSSTTTGEKSSSSMTPTPPRTVDFPLKITPNDLCIVQRRVLGEGNNGLVMIAKYNNILVACKTRREKKSRKWFDANILRELKFAAKLSVCRFINPYVGVMECKYNELRFSEEVIAKPGLQKRPWLDIYVIQRYYEHGDLRDYMEKRDSPLGPFEVLQIALSLFAALADVHALDIGIVDLKLENILVDTTGSAWITDFGSCVEMESAKEIRLSDTRHGWTKSVAAPEMAHDDIFVKASDVFMAMVILCEIMTFEMSDEEFLAKVLIRHKKSNVTFCSDQIHPAYRGFLHILKAGLNNHHRHRPSAQDVFTYLEAMRRDTLKEFSKSLFSSSQSIQLNTKDIIPHSDIDSDLLSERMLCTDDENNRIPYTDDENDKTSGTDEESVSKVKTKPNIQHKHKKKRYTTDPDADYVDYQVLQNHPMTDSHLPQHHKMVSSLFQKTSLDKISETPLAFEYKGKEVEIHPCKEITSKYEANGYPTTEGEKSKPHQLNDTNLTTHCYSVEREISHSSHPTEHHYRRRKSGTPGTYDFLELTCSELSEEYTINDEDISE